MTDDQPNADPLLQYCEQREAEEAKRIADGLCVGCRARFLLGGNTADTPDTHTVWTDDGGIERQRVYRMCFWCLEAEDYDPEADPSPARFHYGNC